MPGRFHHEELYRGAEVLASLANTPVTVCGAGALGSHLADNLARQGFRWLTVIDRDRVEPHNVNTQIYGDSDVGGFKADVLRARLFRSVGVEAAAVAKELTPQNVGKYLKDAGVVIDTFDNSASRQLVTDYCRDKGRDCLHVGLAADYAEVIWNEAYRVPADAPQGDVCDYPLARNLVLLATALATETLLEFLIHGRKLNRSVTLRDFSVQVLESRPNP